MLPGRTVLDMTDEDLDRLAEAIFGDMEHADESERPKRPGHGADRL
jgi:hypothetical protein